MAQARHRHRRAGPGKTLWTRNRAYRQNDSAPCEPQHWPPVRQRFGHERFGHPDLVVLRNDLYAKAWSQFTNHFQPTFKLPKREKKAGRPKRIA